MELDRKAFEAAQRAHSKTYTHADGPLRGAIQAYLAAQESPFGRQPQSVRVILVGDPRDVSSYKAMIRRHIEGNGFDNVTEPDANTLVIHPAAVND